MLSTISITISGKVQGVFYRQSAKQIAIELNIGGEVRNMPDGSVAIKATGTREQLDQFVQWCRQGPPDSVVTGVETQELPLQPFTRFTVVRF